MSREAGSTKTSSRRTGAFWRRDDPDADRHRVIAHNHGPRRSPDGEDQFLITAHVPTGSRSRAGSLGHNNITNSNANPHVAVVRPIPMTRHLSHDSGPSGQPLFRETAVTTTNQRSQGHSEPSNSHNADRSGSRSVIVPTADPRLKIRALPTITTENNVTTSANGFREPDAKDEMQLVADLVSIEVEAIHLLDERRRLESSLEALKDELRIARRQFPDNNPYTEQIAARAKAFESKIALSRSHAEFNNKRGVETRQKLTGTYRDRNNTTVLQDTENRLSAQERSNAKSVEEFKMLEQQLKQSADRQTELEKQLELQAKTISLLQGRFSELEKRDQEDKADAARLFKDQKERSDSLQNTVDSVQEEAKDQKLAVARLNDVFVPRDTFEGLRETVDELKAANSSSVQGPASENFMTRKELEPYIANFNNFGEQIEARLKAFQNRLDDLSSAEKASLVDLQQYATIKDLESFKGDLTSQKHDLGVLDKRVNESDDLCQGLATRLADNLSKTGTLSEQVDKYTSSLELTERSLQAIGRDVLVRTASSATLADEDKQALLQAKVATQSLGLWQKKVDHSIESLSQRYNNLRTDELARHILSTLDPTLAGLKPQINHLQRQVEDLQTIKTSLDGFRKEADEKFADIQARQSGTAQTLTGIILESAKATETLEGLKSFPTDLVKRLNDLEEHSQGLTESLSGVQTASSNIHTALTQIEGCEKEIESLRQDIAENQEKLREEFVNARDSVTKRLDTLETPRPSREQLLREDKAKPSPAHRPSPSESVGVSRETPAARDKSRQNSKPSTPTPRSAAGARITRPSSNRSSPANSSQDQKQKMVTRSGLRECFPGSLKNEDVPSANRSKKDGPNVSSLTGRKSLEVIDISEDEETQSVIDITKWQKPTVQLTVERKITPSIADSVSTHNDDSTIEVDIDGSFRGTAKRKRATVIDDSSSPSQSDDRRQLQGRKKSKKPKA